MSLMKEARPRIMSGAGPHGDAVHYFKTTPEFWVNLQKRFELETAKRSVGATIEREVSTIATYV